MKNSEQYISSRTRRNVAQQYHYDLPASYYTSTAAVQQPPPLAENLLTSIFTPPPENPPPLPPPPINTTGTSVSSDPSDTGGGSSHKKKGGVFGFFKKIFSTTKTKKKKHKGGGKKGGSAVRVDLSEFSSVSSKDSSGRQTPKKKPVYPAISRLSKTDEHSEHSKNSHEKSLSSTSEVFAKIGKSGNASVMSNISDDSDKTSVGSDQEGRTKSGLQLPIDGGIEELEEEDEVEDDDDDEGELPMLSSAVSHLRMTFSRDEDDIQQRAAKGEFFIRPIKTKPDPRVAAMMKLNADSEESQVDNPAQISAATTQPTFSSSDDGVNKRSAVASSEVSPMYLRPTASSMTPLAAAAAATAATAQTLANQTTTATTTAATTTAATVSAVGGTNTKTGSTVTIAADTNLHPGSTSSLINKRKSDRNLKRAQLSAHMSRSFMIRPNSQISALSPLNRAPSTLEPPPLALPAETFLWRPTSQPVLSQQPHVQVVPRYNSTSALATSKPTEEFLSGLPYSPAFQNYYAKSFYLPSAKSPTATALAMHDFNFPAPAPRSPVRGDHHHPTTTATAASSNHHHHFSSDNIARDSFYVPSSPYPRAPASALRRKNSARYLTVSDPTIDQSHYGEIQNFNSLSQFFNSEPFISTAAANNHPSGATIPRATPVVAAVGPQSQPPSHSISSLISSSDHHTAGGLSGTYYDFSDLSEDHSYSHEPTYLDYQRQRERKFEQEKRKKDIERLNEVALREAIEASLEEERSQSSQRTKKYEEIERANEEALRLALYLSMQEVKSRSQYPLVNPPPPLQGSETVSSASNPNTHNNSNSNLNPPNSNSNPSSCSNRSSRGSTFPVEENPYYSNLRYHYPSSVSASQSVSHSHSPSPPPPSLSPLESNKTHNNLSPHVMKKISSGSLSNSGHSRDSRASTTSTTLHYPPSNSYDQSQPQQPQRRTRRIKRVVLDSNYLPAYESYPNNSNTSGANSGTSTGPPTSTGAGRGSNPHPAFHF